MNSIPDEIINKILSLKKQYYSKNSIVRAVTKQAGSRENAKEYVNTVLNNRKQYLSYEKTESKPMKSKVSNVFLTIMSILFVLLAGSLGRVYPLPVGVLGVIYFSIVLGTVINKYKTAKASGEETSELKKAIQSNVLWLILIALILGFQIWSKGGFQSSYSSSNPQTPEEIASYGAKEAKSSLALPNEIDEVTTLTDITSEGNSIKYIYTIHDADTSNLTNSTLKDSIKPSVCSNADAKRLIDQGVNMSYFYTIKETGARYSFTVSNDDC